MNFFHNLKSNNLDTLLLSLTIFSTVLFPYIPITNELFVSFEEFLIFIMLIRLIQIKKNFNNKYSYLILSFTVLIFVTILINKNYKVLSEYFEVYKMLKYLIICVFSYQTQINTSKANNFIHFTFMIVLLFNSLHYYNILNFNSLINIYYDSDGRDIKSFGLNSLGQPDAKRLIGTMGNPNDNAILLLFFFVYFTQNLIKNIETKWFDYLSFVFSIVLILLCQSRTGIVILVLILLHYLYIDKKRWKNNIKYLLLLVSIVGLVIYFDNLTFQYVGNTSTKIEQNNSVMGRLEVWKKLLSEISVKPIFGYGPNKNYIYEHNIYPENEFIFMLWRYGVFGLIFYLFLILYPTIKAFKFRKNNMLYFYSVCIVIIAALTNNPLSNPKFLIIFAIVVGITLRNTDESINLVK